MSHKRPNEDAEHLDSGRRPPGPRAARIRACAECKRHKIKCEPVDDEQKCAKCLRSGVDCVPYNINQRILDEDAMWKANAAAEIAQLRSAVQRLLRHNQLPDIGNESDPSPQSTLVPTVNISPANVVSENGISATMLVPPMDMTRENSVERDLDEESGLVSAPMRSLYELTRIRTLRSGIRWNPKSNSMDDDFIAQGIISKEDAEDLFHRYITHLHQYLWAGVLCRHESLEAVRRHSTLLTAAVLTIAALHTPGHDESLQKCYNTFVSLTYNACLSRLHNLDDIRALTLAAFYLSNLSWKLSGLAVRNAVEMNIHQSFQKLMRGNESHRDNVRLWYALYVCEHQFSIAYGRPPIIHEQDLAIKNIEQFLDSPQTTQGDIRLGAQIALFKILTEAYFAYGSDPEQPLTETDFQQLRMFNFAIEQWRLAFQPRSADHSGIGSYPSKGVVLYYHFARFQLNSLALRALPPPSAASSDSLSYDRREAANIAISAATNTLTLIFEEPDLRRAMTAVPIFTHTMVAFCATFLLKMARTWGGVAQAASPEWTTTEPVGLGLNFNIAQVLSLARRATGFLSRVAENLNEKHLTRHIVNGIQELLKLFEGADLAALGTGSGTGLGGVNGGGNNAGAPGSGVLHAGLQEALHGGGGVEQAPPEQQQLMNGYNMYDLIGSYGFGFDETFLGQAASTDFDIWPTEPI